MDAMRTGSRGSALEVFLAFLKLGLTSFGGPAAHIGYFRVELVERRAWTDHKSYSDLVALCQFLPGGSSSQISIALGLERAGWTGAIAAWLGFTLPSAMAFVLFAAGATQWAGLSQSGAIHGLKVMAVAVVAQAVWGMAKTLCPDRPRAGLAIGAALLVLAAPTALGQMAAIVMGGLVGRWGLVAPIQSTVQRRHCGVSKLTGAIFLSLFVLLLTVLPLLAAISRSPALAVAADFYRAGASVFGGGHVVLPLLQAIVVPTGLLSSDVFLAGYGAAQAVPGPMFAFAAYLGAAMTEPFSGWAGGLIVMVAMFTPAFLLVIGTLPYWELLRQRDGVQRAMAGVNAAVVGLLLAAFYDPLWSSAIHTRADFGLALAAFALLVVVRCSPVPVVVLSAIAGLLLPLAA